MTDNKLGITLSLGEQSRETYQRWFNAGAHRYLLRIEASSEALYRRVHPDDDMHRYNRRLECLKTIQETGYQTGTGVMVRVGCGRGVSVGVETTTRGVPSGCWKVGVACGITGAASWVAMASTVLAATVLIRSASLT